MAVSAIDTELVILYDRWPTYKVLETPPPGGMVATAHPNVATAVYPEGTKVILQQNSGSTGTGIPHGSSTFIYLKCDSNVATAPAMAVLSVSAPLAQSENGTGLTVYVVDNVTGAENTGLIAIALSTMTNSRYGWFWCGGVAPVAHVTTLAGDLLTDTSVVAGEIIACQTDAANNPLGLKIATAGVVACGIALAADD